MGDIDFCNFYHIRKYRLLSAIVVSSIILLVHLSYPSALEIEPPAPGFHISSDISLPGPRQQVKITPIDSMTGPRSLTFASIYSSINTEQAVHMLHCAAKVSCPFKVSNHWTISRSGTYRCFGIQPSRCSVKKIVKASPSSSRASGKGCVL